MLVCNIAESSSAADSVSMMYTMWRVNMWCRTIGFLHHHHNMCTSMLFKLTLYACSISVGLFPRCIANFNLPYHLPSVDRTSSAQTNLGMHNPQLHDQINQRRFTSLQRLWYLHLVSNLFIPSTVLGSLTALMTYRWAPETGFLGGR